MSTAQRIPGHVGSPEMRAVIRARIVGTGGGSSLEIARGLELSHETVVRIMERFEAAGYLRLKRSSSPGPVAEVVVGGLSDHFKDLALAL